MNWKDDLDREVERFLKHEAAKKRVADLTRRYPGPRIKPERPVGWIIFAVFSVLIAILLIVISV